MAGNLRCRLLRQDDDRGSLVMAMLLIMLGTMFAGLLVPVVIAQVNTSKFDTRRDHALDAAQAGVDVALGKIRDANDGSGNGVLAGLPCTAFGAITGSMSGAGAGRYHTDVYYFAQDPRGHDEWINDPSKQLVCVSATSGPQRTPGYALIVSTGTDDTTGSTPGRTIYATYVFKTKNSNVQGGLIHSYGSDPDLCLDAGSSSPAPGTIVTLRRCASGTDQQLWSYNYNLTVSLVATADPASHDLGLCLDAPYPHASGEPVVVQPCASTTTSEQQWSFTGHNNLPATTSSGGQESLCWNPQSANTVGANLVLGACGARDTAHAFLPEPAVGAGNADVSQKFEVNYSEFGRCLDATNEALDPSNVSYQKFLIAFPCKVTPDTSKPPTNQQWNMPAVPDGADHGSGHITSVKDSSYCLISPMTLGGYPYMDKCSNAPSDASKTWTVWRDTGEYTTSYRISDSATPPSSTIGYCLQPSDPTQTPPDNYTDAGSDISKIIVTTCSGSTLQKWDAPPGIQSIPVKDYHEK